MAIRHSGVLSLLLISACARPPVAASGPHAAIEPERESTFQAGVHIFESIHARDDVRRACESSLQALTVQRDALRARVTSGADDGLVLDALLAFDAKARVAENTAFLVSRVHPTREVRLEASGCSPRLDALVTDVASGNVLERLTRTRGRNDAESRYLANLVDEAKRQGAALSPDDRARLAVLDGRIETLKTAMNDAIGQGTKTIHVASSRLRGMPQPFLNAHVPDASGLVALTTDSNDVNAVQRFAEDRSLARDLFESARDRAYPENEAPLHDLLDARKREASLLGFESWADLCAASRMVGTRARTVAFLGEIQGLLAPVSERYQAALDPTGHAPVPPESDAPYLEDRVAKGRDGMNVAQVTEYFEAERTLRGMLDVIGEVYGVRFIETHELQWSPDVTTFEVRRDDGAVVGRFYFDLFARPGKPTNGGTTIPFVPRSLSTPGPVEVAILTNFVAPQTSAPSLVTPEQLGVLLHETGHALHYMLMPSGSVFFRREADFFDVPSQVMEAFIAQPAFLERVGRHYRTNAPLPDGAARALAAHYSFRVWQDMRRFMVGAELDVRFHAATPPTNTTLAYSEAFEQIQPYAFDRRTHPDASLVLPTLAYDGNGHALAWGLAIATDVVGELQERGFFAPKAWRAYIDEVLAQDGPADARLAKFLHRPWSNGRFRRLLDTVVAASPAAPAR